MSDSDERGKSEEAQNIENHLPGNVFLINASCFGKSLLVSL